VIDQIDAQEKMFDDYMKRKQSAEEIAAMSDIKLQDELKKSVQNKELEKTRNLEQEIDKRTKARERETEAAARERERQQKAQDQQMISRLGAGLDYMNQVAALGGDTSAMEAQLSKIIERVDVIMDNSAESTGGGAWLYQLI